MISNLIIGQRTQTWASTVSNTITVQNWANGQLGICRQNASESLSKPIILGDQHPGIAINGDGVPNYD